MPHQLFPKVYGLFTLVAALVLSGLILFSLQLSVYAAPPEPYIVKPINWVEAPTELTAINGTLYFYATGSAGRRGLWKSDGTDAGTVVVKGDIALVRHITNVNGTLFFMATDPDHGWELWKSDGTTLGTTLVKDINPGPNGSFTIETILVNVNGTLFLNVDDGVHGEELWKSNGTEAGTVLVKDTTSGLCCVNSTGMTYLTAFKNKLYYTGCPNDSGGCGLFVSDGTAAGTGLLRSRTELYGTGYLMTMNDTLYFAGGFGGYLDFGAELWRSDGTAAGTYKVKNIFPGYYGAYPQLLTNVNGTLFFTAVCCQDGHPETATGRELWKSDGTAAGTVIVKDINPGGGSMTPFDYPMINAAGTLYFVADDGTHGFELWKSNGTAAGTVLVKDINPADVALHTYDLYSLANVNSTLYFRADDGMHGSELWTSDGSEAGTVMVKDLNPGATGSLPVSGGDQQLINVNGVLFFVADDGVHGSQLWALNPKVNAQLTQVSVSTTSTTIPDATYPAQSTKGVLTALLKLNNKESALRNVSFRVTTLTNNNYLLNANGGPGQVGSQLSVANDSLPSGNQLWDKNELLTQTFRIGLLSRNSFSFFVEVYAAPVLIGAANADQAANPATADLVGSFTIEIAPDAPLPINYTLYLPVVNK